MMLATSLAASAEGEIEIEVVGLFRNAALLEVNGKRELLKQGQKSPEGILLIRADSSEAVVEVNGRRMNLKLSSRIGTEFVPAESATVQIPVNDLGQYQGSGSINDQPVSFLVDTGASIVAMNTKDARKLGIDYAGTGKMHEATTAGGVVKSWAVTLDSVQIGAIRVTNVPAAVLEGDYPKDILLGMTFLRNVEIKQTQGLMVLKRKF
jgi:aspartyl protease family protein